MALLEQRPKVQRFLAEQAALQLMILAAAQGLVLEAMAPPAPPMQPEPLFAA